MADRLAEAGAQTSRPPKFAPIFVAASLTGLYTQRSVFHDPSNVVTQRFYGGRPDTLWDGLNIELSNELTLIRRFGNSLFSAATYPQAPNCAFSFELDDGTIQVLIDTDSFVYWDQQNGSKTTIFTKGAGAGQGYFVASGDVLYFGDGVDLLKYTPGNPNGLVWNWGIVAPTAQPGVTIVESGSAATVWQANTYYSTMGLLYDGTNIQQLYTVNANATNPNSQYGKSSNGQPTWNQSPGGTTTDGGVTWTNQGSISAWAPNTVYASGQCIYVVIAGTAYIFSATHNFPTTSGPSPPTWNTALMSTGARTSETNAGGATAARWGCLGAIGITPSMVQPWTANTPFNTYVEPSTGSDSTTLNNCTIEPTLVLPPGTGQTVFLQGATTPGTTGSGTNPPTWATTAGLTTNDGQLGWRMVSSATWQATTGYTPWYLGATMFGALYVTVGASNYFQVCTVGGTSNNIQPNTAFTLTAASAAAGGNTTYTGTFSPTLTVGYPVTITGFSNIGNNTTGKVVSCNSTTLVLTNPNGVLETHAGTATFNPWGTTYGATVTDGTVTWTCVGTAVTWTANSTWYLPAVGFAAPTSSQPYGGASVVANGDVQYVISSGESGTSAPAWGAIGTTTTDNGITWYTQSAFVAQSLAWTSGYSYAYSYECRTANDPFNTAAPPGAMNPLGPYLGGGTGAISTASPPFIITGANTGAVNTISGLYSQDPQVDTIDIWRSADGGGSDNMFLLTKIPNNPNAPLGTMWQFADFLPDVPTALYPGLNELIPAPIDDSNNPPPAGFRPLCNKLHFSRIFGAVANTVFFSGGPDVITGNPNEAFNPVDNFPFQSTVIACIHTPSGLICPTTTDFECIYGGPTTSSFFDNTMLPGVGMLSYNAWDLFGGEIYFISSDSQFWTINPATQLARVGFPIGDKIAALDASKVYVTVHESGTDNAIYLGDGSTGWYRLNPHQVGADMAGENVSVWSPRATINFGPYVASIGYQSGANVSSISVTLPNPVAVGDFVVTYYGITASGGVTISSVVDNFGNNYSGGVVQLTTGQSGTLTLTFTFTGTITAGDVVGFAVRNSSAYGFARTSGSSPLTSPSGPTTVDNALVIGAGAFGNVSAAIATTDTRPVILNATYVGIDAQGQVPSGTIVSSTWSATGGINGVADIWEFSPAITGGGCQMLQSVVTSPGVRELLIGAGTINQSILKRDLTVFTDNGTPYEAWGDIGAITLVFPGQRAEVKFVEFDFMQVGTQPLVYYALDDPTPSPTWNALQAFVFDPPIVYAGTAITPPYWPDRFNLQQNPLPNVCRRIRLKFDFGSVDTVRNELTSFAIFGRKKIEQ